MRWLFDLNRYHDRDSDIIGLAYKGYTTLIDRVPNSEPNSITLSADHPDFARSSNKNQQQQQQQQQHPSTNNRHHHTSNKSGGLNNNHNHNNNQNSGPVSININNNNSSLGHHNNTTTLNNNIVPSQSTSKSLKDGTSYSNNTMLSGPMSITNETENGAIRKSPEGKDNDAIRHEDNKLTRDAAMQKYRENNGNGNQHPKIGNDISTEIFSTSNDNGKINVQVTVLVDTHNQSHAGTTLANLKKQRAQSRNSGTLDNGSLLGAPPSITSTNSLCTPAPNFPNRNSGASSMDMSLLSASTNDILNVGPNQSITKFSGVTSDVVSDSTRSRRCCIVM